MILWMLSDPTFYHIRAHHISVSHNRQRQSWPWREIRGKTEFLQVVQEEKEQSNSGEEKPHFELMGKNYVKKNKYCKRVL